MVINHHGDFDAPEIYHILNFLFITRQVGAENDRELGELLCGKIELPFPEQYLSITFQKFRIAVVLYKDRGLQRSQQMFTDLNKHAVTTSKSLNTLYESKDPVALITKKTVDSIPFLRKYTDKEKDNLSKYSSNIFTLNTFQEANKRIYKVIQDPKKAEQLVYSFWNNVVLNMREWNEMDNGELSKKSLREDYITTQGLIILALGRLCEFYCANPEIHMVQSLKGLKKIDWLRNNEECWMNRAIKPNGKINRNEQGIFLTYIQIKRLLSLPITNEELKKEQKMRG